MSYTETMETAMAPIGCVKSATEILGDKWTPLLLRYFFNEDEVRFCQLQDSVGGINPRTLSARLLFLERRGVIERVYDKSSTRCTYRLTEKGSELMPILHDMELWGMKYTAQTA